MTLFSFNLVVSGDVDLIGEEEIVAVDVEHLWTMLDESIMYQEDKGKEMTTCVDKLLGVSLGLFFPSLLSSFGSFLSHMACHRVLPLRGFLLRDGRELEPVIVNDVKATSTPQIWVDRRLGQRQSVTEAIKSWKGPFGSEWDMTDLWGRLSETAPGSKADE